MSTTTLTGPRWSSAVVCARKAVYEGLGAEREPVSPELQAIFRRGRYIGQAIAADLTATLEEQGRPAGEPEREIPWPAADPVGVGHADYYVPDVREIIEVLSSADGTLPANKPLQAAGYALNDPEAESARVLVIDPSSYAEDAYPVDVEGLRPEVEEIQARVAHGLRTGKVPERPERIESPTQRPCFDCPFRRECWKTWEPYPVGTLPAELHADLERLAHLEDTLARSRRMNHLEIERTEIRERLKGRMLEGGLYRGKGITVKWTSVAARRTFRLADYEKTGHTLPEHAQEFVSEGGGYDRWTVKRVEG